MTYYTTKGDVRGYCGHEHRSIETAAKCVKRDMAGCQSQGGYSDRSVIRVVDGERVELSKAIVLFLEARV
tara:strand:+ start:89 stop:298 length:210 start_codon:yes stop_codon:yes gene_type:complete